MTDWAFLQTTFRLGCWCRNPPEWQHHSLFHFHPIHQTLPRQQRIVRPLLLSVWAIFRRNEWQFGENIICHHSFHITPFIWWKWWPLSTFCCHHCIRYDKLSLQQQQQVNMTAISTATINQICPKKLYHGHIFDFIKTCCAPPNVPDWSYVNYA